MVEAHLAAEPVGWRRLYFRKLFSWEGKHGQKIANGALFLIVLKLTPRLSKM
jgi:hypothetical protein